MESPRSKGLAWPLFVLSAAVLAQELLLVRLIAVPLWHHITYMVVTSALLAFGVAGTALVLFPRLGGAEQDGGRKAFGGHCVGFAAGTLLAGAVIQRTSIDTVDLLTEPALLLPLFGLYLVAGLPLFFGGLAVAAALKHAGDGLARSYFANLFGSALGCALFLLLLGPLTGPHLLLATAALALLAALMSTRARSVRFSALGLLLLLALVAMPGPMADLVLPEARFVQSKEIHHYQQDLGHKIERTLWNPLCRIDITEPPASAPDRTKMIFQDGDAPTFLFPRAHAPAAETLVPYTMRPGLKSLLVIGAGGGRELDLATQQGVDRIVGLEINATTASLLTDHYREFTGNIPAKPGVELVNAEGRAWLARHDETFDWIQMTGVDTYAALNSGAYVASESYLYTSDAFDSYLRHIKPGGYFSIIRLFFEPDRETLRLYVMALDALKRIGVSDPGKHAIVLKNGPWGILVIGRDPIPTERTAAVRAIVAASGNTVSLHHDPEQDLGSPFSAYAKACAQGTESAFCAAYPFDVSPVDDDSPFFYLQFHWGTVFKRLFGIEAEDSPKGMHKTVLGSADPWLANTGQIPTGQLVLLGLLAQAILFAVLLVLGPLLAMKRRALTVPGAGRAITYFLCLGLGFMLFEIALAQKLALFLGHPTWSLAIVIGGMLLASGLGALWSGRRDAAGLTLRAPISVTIAAVALALLLPVATDAWLGFPHLARCGLALVLIGPAAFLMGMPMPSGLRLLAARNTELVPWAWGVNGVASVAGSILAIILAMEFGFTAVLLIAAGLYACAAWSRPVRT
jgi:spermidine synthase